MKLNLTVFILWLFIFSGCSREWDEPLLIAYDDSTNIYIMDDDGKNVSQLTSGTHPSFSPDGKYIVFCKGVTNLYLLNIETGQERFLTSDPGLFPYSTWSPDGLKIAFLKNNRLYTMNTDGIIDPEISTVNTNQGPITWSPDSKIIACTNNGTGEIYYFNVNNHIRTLTGITSVTGLSFAPEADEIAYTDITNFYIAKSDFSSARIISSTAFDKVPSWSPDGKNLVYEYNNNFIIIINSANGSSIQIAGPGCHNPCFQGKPH